MNRRQFIVGGGGLVLGGAGVAAVNVANMGSTDDYETAVTALRMAPADLSRSNELIRLATLAASGHNTQPWRFRVGADRIDILPDFERRTPIVDPDDHHLFVSLGCAVENLSLAAAAGGRPGLAGFDAANDGAVSFSFEGNGAPVRSPLFDAIAHRQSTRADYDGRSVGVAQLKSLVAAAKTPGVDMALITDRSQIEAVLGLVLEGNSAQMTDPAFMRELKTWLRFNPREALATGDGLYSAASGSPKLPNWLGPMMFDGFVNAEGENEKYAAQLRSSAGLAVFVSQQEDKAHWVRAGQACQRFALQATALGLKHAFVNQPVEVASLRPELAALLGMPGRRPDIVMRFGYGPTLPYSARRPVAAVLA
jgi:hypothetical protein